MADLSQIAINITLEIAKHAECQKTCRNHSDLTCHMNAHKLNKSGPVQNILVCHIYNKQGKSLLASRDIVFTVRIIDQIIKTFIIVRDGVVRLT